MRKEITTNVLDLVSERFHSDLINDTKRVKRGIVIKVEYEVEEPLNTLLHQIAWPIIDGMK
jgi:hypothetical protein